MIQIKLFTKQTHRLRKQIYGGGNKLGCWDQHIHTTIYKIGFSWWLSGKEYPSNAGDEGLICGLGRFPEKEMVTHSSILAWETLWTEEPGRLQSAVLQEFDMILQPNNIHKIDNQQGSTNSIGNYEWYFVITYKGTESEKEYVSIYIYL